jgi:hypothetical protein
MATLHTILHRVLERLAICDFHNIMQKLAAESIATIPPFGPIEHKSGLTRFPANESPRRTGLRSSLSAKSSFYLPAFEISRSCRTASEHFCSSRGYDKSF